jgi:hypothetical protein
MVVDPLGRTIFNLMHHYRTECDSGPPQNVRHKLARVLIRIGVLDMHELKTCISATPMGGYGIGKFHTSGLL